ncbi:MAG: hypothetical protein GAK45_00138 [Pseudomonas citronellolis]|nr:MAG: hypothetical protein GAK45_00138 [Pseudomonas citronellolis]
MSTLRQVLYGIALLSVLGLLLWTQHLRSAAETARADLANEQQDRLQALNNSQADSINVLQGRLQEEAQAQANLRTAQNQLRDGLATRQRQIEELTRENQELRDWAAQPLPAAARQLRERPLIVGADAYRDWLSSRGAVQPAGDQPKQ